MNRYSMLWGTSDTGEYRRLWYSKRLADFLGALGATDPARAADTAQNILRSFGNYSEYSEQPIDDKPVAVHYAPMHLYKLPEFPGNLKPFCAWSVTGAENRIGGRNSTYSHTLVFPYEMMLGTDKSINYIDVLFGTKCLSWQEIKAFREKVRTPAFDAAPEKVHIEFTDLKAAVYAAALLIEAKGEKNLIIRLEKNCLFNRRAFTLLSQIYALLPPKLATETGFATYHPVEDIAGISSKNSICVFVLPASAEIQKCVGGKNIILDLADENCTIPLQKSALTEMLVQWSALPADKRCAAFEKLFEDVPAYLDSRVFAQRSNEFFNNIRSFEEWLSASGEGKIESLEDIRTLFAEHAEWTRIPWYKDQFRQRIPALLPKNVRFGTLLDSAVTKYHFAQSDAEKKDAGELYRIGSQFGEIDILGLCQTVSSQQNDLTEARFLPKLEEAKTQYNLLQQKCRDEIVAQKREADEHEQKIVADYESKISAAEGRHAAEIAAQKEAAEKEKIAACADAEDRLKKAEEIFRQMKRDLAERDEKLRSGAAELSTEQSKHEQTRQRLSAAEENSRALRHEIESAEHRIERLGGWPRFLTKMPWWLPLVASLLIGAIAVGAVWGITSLVGKGKEEPEAVTTEAVATTGIPAITTTETQIETTEAIPETSELQEKPSFAYNDWQNEETAHQLRLAVPDIVTVQTDEAVQALCPAELEGYTVQALLSTEELIFAPTDEDNKQKFDAENYALLLLKPEDVEAADLTKISFPGLVLHKDNQILLTCGNDKIMNAAINTIRTITVSEEKSAEPEGAASANSAEIPSSAETAADTFEMLWVLEDGNVIDLGKSIAAITETDEWWQNMADWCTDDDELQQGQEALNSARTPIWTVAVADHSYYLYDYRDEPEKVRQFVDNNEDHKIEVLGDFVLIDAAELQA